MDKCAHISPILGFTTTLCQLVNTTGKFIFTLQLTLHSSHSSMDLTTLVPKRFKIFKFNKICWLSLMLMTTLGKCKEKRNYHYGNESRSIWTWNVWWNWNHWNWWLVTRNQLGWRTSFYWQCSICLHKWFFNLQISNYRIETWYVLCWFQMDQR